MHQSGFWPEVIIAGILNGLDALFVKSLYFSTTKDWIAEDSLGVCFLRSYRSCASLCCLD